MMHILFPIYKFGVSTIRGPGGALHASFIDKREPNKPELPANKLLNSNFMIISIKIARPVHRFAMST